MIKITQLSKIEKKLTAKLRPAKSMLAGCLVSFGLLLAAFLAFSASPSLLLRSSKSSKSLAVMPPKPGMAESLLVSALFVDACEI